MPVVLFPSILARLSESGGGGKSAMKRPVWEVGYCAYYNRYNTTGLSGGWSIVHTTIYTILQACLGDGVLCILLPEYVYSRSEYPTRSRKGL